MKTQNKWELKQIAPQNSSSDIDFQDFINLYKNVLQNHILFLVIDNTLASDNPSGFQKNLIEII